MDTALHAGYRQLVSHCSVRVIIIGQDYANNDMTQKHVTVY